MWAITIAAILGLIILLCLLASVPLVKRHPSKEFHSPTEYGLENETVSFSTDKGIILHGYWIPYAASTRTVIMLHGYAGSLDPDLKYTPHLHSAGYNILLFDFRAHGRSAGNITTMGALERADVKAAVRFARLRGSTWIALLGFSMGGRAAILAAPHIPEVAAVISDGAPARLSTAATQDLHLRGLPLPLAALLSRMMLLGASILSGVNLFKDDPIHQAGKLRGIPILFINGQQDLYITRDEMEKMVRDAGPLASLWSVPEAKHRNIEVTRPEEYLQRILSFLQTQSSNIQYHGEAYETH
jgi:pimeloyl-ACP methyl ester carboxylesterase